jgi:hypothetical protein
MYRLFLLAPGFDADLDDTELRYRWLHKCENMQCLDLILENLYIGFLSLPVEARFNFAVRVGIGGGPIQPSLFLKCIGLSQSDQRLASLRSSNGESVLHYIACILCRIGVQGDISKQWLDLGVNVLKNGADPSCIARRECWGISRLRDIDPHSAYWRQAEWCNTPLMDALDIENWGLRKNTPFLATDKLTTIQIWTEMLQQAGVDLCKYGNKESYAWKSLGLEESSKINGMYCGTPRVGQLLYGPSPADWSLMIYSADCVPVFKFHPPPGAFTEIHNIPTMIIWYPTEEEMNEGPWEYAEERRIKSKYRDLRDADIKPTAPFKELVDEVQDDNDGLWEYSEEMRIKSKYQDLRDADIKPTAPFKELVDGVQDDCGSIMLMHLHADRPRGYTSRSHSQPRHSYHREAEYAARRHGGRNGWFEYHLCLFNSQWRLGFHEGYYYYNEVLQISDPRNCVKDISNKCHSVQESWRWKNRSFLRDIAKCQDKYETNNNSRGMLRSMRHTATSNCPQGCSKIDLDRIQVPEELRYFHPRRTYEYLRTEDDIQGEI